MDNIYPLCSGCNGEMRDSMFDDYCIKKKYLIPKRVEEYIKKIKKN
jgi:hypothetical protein